MSIRILALDLDGTLLGPTYKIGPKDFEAVQQVKGLGIIVVLLTGRRFRIALPYALALGLDSPIVVHNGALIKATTTEQVIFCEPLALIESQEVIRMGRKNDLDPVVTLGPEGFSKVVIDTVDKNNKQLTKYLWLSAEDVLRVDDLIEYLKVDPVQVTFSGKPRKVEKLISSLNSTLTGGIKILQTRYLERDFAILDVVNPRVSKGTALVYLASHYGIQRKEILAIGDNLNDLDMLTTAGTGVVMGNADEKLKAMGFPITLTNEQGGVAEAIKRYIFQ